MKRILIAISISLVGMVSYHFLVYAISPFVLDTPPLSIHPVLYTPISLPPSAFQAFAPDVIQDTLAANPAGGLAARLLFFVGNVALYAVPIYLLSLLIFRGKE